MGLRTLVIEMIMRQRPPRANLILAGQGMHSEDLWEAEFLVADEERFGVDGDYPQRPCASKVCSTHASERQASAKNEAKKALIDEKRACVGCSEFFHSTCWGMEDGLGQWEEGEAEMYCRCMGSSAGPPGTMCN